MACPTVLILIMLFHVGIQEILGPLARDNLGRVRTCGLGSPRRGCFVSFQHFAQRAADEFCGGGGELLAQEL